jgi:hypothetical protein
MGEPALVKILLVFGIVLALALWELRRTPKQDDRHRREDELD